MNRPNVSIISKRLRELRESHKLTQEKLCNELKEYADISVQTIRNYEAAGEGKGSGKVPSSTRGMKLEYLFAYAKYFNVSADWILGLHDVSNLDPDMKIAHEYTGLSSNALGIIHYLKKMPYVISRFPAKEISIKTDVSWLEALDYLICSNSLIVLISIMAESKSRRIACEWLHKECDINFNAIQPIQGEWSHPLFPEQYDDENESDNDKEDIEEITGIRIDPFYDIDKLTKADIYFALDEMKKSIMEFIWPEEGDE